MEKKNIIVKKKIQNFILFKMYPTTEGKFHIEITLNNNQCSTQRRQKRKHVNVFILLTSDLWIWNKKKTENIILKQKDNYLDYYYLC